MSESEELEMLELENENAHVQKGSEPTGQTPPANPNFEVAGRSQAFAGSAPSYAPPDSTNDSGISPTRALLTNEPTSGFAEDVIRGVPSTIGGLAGGTVGLVAGAPLTVGAAATSAGGAALGGAAGEASRQAVAQAYAGATGRPFTAPGEVLGNVASQGLAQGGGQALGLGLTELAGLARPYANKLGAQSMRAFQGVPEKAGGMLTSDPSIVLDAMSPADASAAYRNFESKTGLTGLSEQIRTTGKAPSEGELEKHLFEVAARTRNGVPSTPQELYHASQAASNLKMMGKMGSPRYASLAREIGEAKGIVDGALEQIHPEYGQLRTDYAQSKAADQLNSVFPLNKNGSPNALRSALAADTAARGAFDGNYLGLLALPLTSPMTSRTVLQGAALLGKVPAPVYRVIGKTAAGAIGSALEQAYMGQRPAIP